MIVGHDHVDLPSNRILAWLATLPDGAALYSAIGKACGIGMRGGAVASACRSLERCGWVLVTEPAEYVSRRKRLARECMTVTITPAGRLWTAYVQRQHLRPVSRMEMFSKMLALEDAVRPLAAIGLKAREAGAKDGDVITTKLPASYALLAAEIIYPPPGQRPAIYPWTPGHINRKHEVLGNEQPKK